MMGDDVLDLTGEDVDGWEHGAEGEEDSAGALQEELDATENELSKVHGAGRLADLVAGGSHARKQHAKTSHDSPALDSPAVLTCMRRWSRRS